MRIRRATLALGVFGASIGCGPAKTPVVVTQSDPAEPTRVGAGAETAPTATPRTIIEPLASNIASFDFDPHGNIGFIRYGWTQDDPGLSFVLLDCEGNVRMKLPFSPDGDWINRISWSHDQIWQAWQEMIRPPGPLRVLEFDAVAGSVVSRYWASDGHIGAYSPDHRGGFVTQVQYPEDQSVALESRDGEGFLRRRLESQNAPESGLPWRCSAEVLMDGRIILCEENTLNLYVYSSECRYSGILGSGESWYCTRNSYQVDAGFDNQIVIIPPTWSALAHVAEIGGQPDAWNPNDVGHFRGPSRGAYNRNFSSQHWTNVPIETPERRDCYFGGFRIAPSGHLWVGSRRGLERLDENGDVDLRIAATRVDEHP